jgi:rSAM-associated Gly-rich repeat protein
VALRLQAIRNSVSVVVTLPNDETQSTEQPETRLAWWGNGWHRGWGWGGGWHNGGWGNGGWHNGGWGNGGWHNGGWGNGWHNW